VLPWLSRAVRPGFCALYRATRGGFAEIFRLLVSFLPWPRLGRARTLRSWHARLLLYTSSVLLGCPLVRDRRGFHPALSVNLHRCGPRWKLYVVSYYLTLAVFADEVGACSVCGWTVHAVGPGGGAWRGPVLELGLSAGPHIRHVLSMPAVLWSVLSRTRCLRKPVSPPEFFAFLLSAPGRLGAPRSVFCRSRLLCFPALLCRNMLTRSLRTAHSYCALRSWTCRWRQPGLRRCSCTLWAHNPGRVPTRFSGSYGCSGTAHSLDARSCPLVEQLLPAAATLTRNSSGLAWTAICALRW